MKFISFISNRIKDFFSNTDQKTPNETDGGIFEKREKIIAFSFALFFAICLWLIVNMGRDFNVTLEIPIRLANLPDDVALSSPIPDHVSVNVAGEGWNLISLYSNPPVINLSAESERVNVQEQIRNQIGSFSNLNIIQVEPNTLQIETEEKVTKRVPIIKKVDISLRDQYGYISEPRFEPDSVTITGAATQIEPISSWETVDITISDVNSSIERNVRLKSPDGGIRLDPSEVRMSVEVAEFTEAEVRIPVRTRNMPPGQAVTYNPSSVTVRFNVPITQYSNVVDTRPFSAYVDYADLEADTTGMIAPTIETDTDLFNVQLRNYQPSRVSYFNIVP